MTNLERLVTGLGGIIVTQKPAEIGEKVLRLVACPFESVEDPDSLQIDGCPSETQCAECKRKWLAKEVGK